jgi:ATP/maltotriose-dependent transcriptional regulator MalT
MEGDTQKAIEIIQKIKDEAIKLKDQAILVEINIDLAEYLIEDGEFSQAENLLLDLVPDTKQNQDKIYLNWLISKVWLGQNKLAEAEKILDEASELLQPDPSPVDRFRINWAKCVLLGTMGKLDQAIAVGEDVLEEVYQIENPFYQAGVHLDLAELFKKRGRKNDAQNQIQHVKNALEIFHRLPAPARARRLTNELKMYET